MGGGLAATVVVFDPHNDIAVLSVPRLHAATLALGQRASARRVAAILGYPHDGGFKREPGRLGQTQVTANPGTPTATRHCARSAHCAGSYSRVNSGGPLVDEDGQVLATVFAQVQQFAPRANPAVSRFPTALSAPVE